MRKKRSLAANIGIAVGIFFIFVFLYFIGARYGYEKYEDPKAGIRIMYPRQWKVIPNLGGTLVVFESPRENELDIFKENVSIVMQDLSEDRMNLKDYSETAMRQLLLTFKGDIEVITAEQHRLSGKPGFIFIYQNKSGDARFKNVSIWTIKDMRAYQVNYTGFASQYDRYKNRLGQMIRSFKITR